MILLDDSLTNSETNATTGIFFACVQPFKESKDALLELRLDSNAVVGNGKLPASRLSFGIDLHDGIHSHSSILNGVADQILEKLLQMCAMNLDRRQPIDDHFSLGLCDHARQVCENSSKTVR